MNWTKEEIGNLFQIPFFDVVSQARKVHLDNFESHQIEMCSLINIKSGGCPEDCGFCNQSAHFKTDLEKENLLDLDIILDRAREMKDMGVRRCCMGAAWRRPNKRDFPKVLETIKQVKKLGLEVCVTLGFLDTDQAAQLKEAGLDFYNHNIETSPEFYPKTVSTHSFQDRVDTVNTVADAGLRVCSGGILGLGETRSDRINFLYELTQLTKPPESIPINRMIQFEGTPLESEEKLDIFEFIRTIAITRIIFPKSMVRLSGKRRELSDVEQALCFYVGANSIFVGGKLLTDVNQTFDEDMALMSHLGLQPTGPKESPCGGM